MRTDTTPPEARPPEDVIDLLVRQHREVEDQLDALLDADGVLNRSRLLALAGDALAAHLSAEEQVFYPAVRAKRTEGILLESLEEHLSLKRLLADLMALSPNDTTFVPKCKVLQEQAEHHHREEEEHLFPKVRQLLDDTQRIELGAAVQAHEDQLHLHGDPRDDLPGQTDAAEPLR